MSTAREVETPFTVGVASFNLPYMSDALKAEVERRLSGLRIEYDHIFLRDEGGDIRARIAWKLPDEEKPTYTRTGFTVVEV